MRISRMEWIQVKAGKTEPRIGFWKIEPWQTACFLTEPHQSGAAETVPVHTYCI